MTAMKKGRNLQIFIRVSNLYSKASNTQFDLNNLLPTSQQITLNLINLGTTWSLLCAEFTVTTQKCTLQHKRIIRRCTRLKRHQWMPYIYATVAKIRRKEKKRKVEHEQSPWLRGIYVFEDVFWV